MKALEVIGGDPRRGGALTSVTPATMAFLCSPYHRGGIERWMVDMAVAWRRQYGRSWFVVPRPRRPFINGVGRPAVCDLVAGRAAADRPALIAPLAGDGYEFGTEAYRASRYADAVLSGVPAGVPLVVSDDPSAWRAAAWVAGRNPFIATVHGEWPGYDDLVRRYAEHVSAFVGVSERVTRRVRALTADGRAPVVTIPCGIPVPATPRRVHEPTDVVRLAWVGRIREEAKRVSDLPKIAHRLRERGVRFELTIMGDGEERPALEQEIVRCGVEDVVRLAPWGTPSAAQALLGSSDVLLLPSNREGMPITVMEALSLGCGVVASRVSGVEDYEHHPLAAGCLWVYDIGDVEAAANAVEQAAAVERARRAARARELAAAEFAVERAVERYAALIPELIHCESLPRGLVASHEFLLRLSSTPVAAQRILRVWIRGRYHRPARVEVGG